MALRSDVPMREISARNPLNMPYKDLRTSSRDYDFIMEFNIDSFQKYNTASTPQDEVLHDVKMTFFPMSTYTLDEVM